MDAFGIENHGYSPLISQKYVVKGDFEVYDGMDLLHHAMLNTLPNINKDGGKDEHGKTIRIPDFEARQKADTLITEIRQAFVEWLHAQPDDFKERLTDLYNRKFNCYVRPRYDGSHQQFPGLDLRPQRIVKTSICKNIFITIINVRILCCPICRVFIIWLRIFRHIIINAVILRILFRQ